ncbi:Sec-independent protein translocase protein TatB [Sphingomonas sp. SRS2]|uniref:Sec-independent protein translocase protein TatB n=1 Tax=Sphingomonas sp. SRS2 TaxID=133190 RepID=UPI00061841B7|nr:Sec-independent protein translocase protein TatB [Sphingomonas sp. SRS2]KKC26760.1 preprotein translocase subunit TatA [Sphingomonas sp. SRS2]
MFDVAPTELLLVAVVALLVIGPKDLPRAMRFVGQWVAKARGVARHFRSGMDEMIRQAELEEMEKKWAAENDRIMHEHPPQSALIEGEMLPLAAPSESTAPAPPETPAATPASADLFDQAPAEPQSRPLP